jgi:Ni/Co efflux regulator RcnB
MPDRLDRSVLTKIIPVAVAVTVAAAVAITGAATATTTTGKEHLSLINSTSLQRNRHGRVHRRRNGNHRFEGRDRHAAVPGRHDRPEDQDRYHQVNRASRLSPD